MKATFFQRFIAYIIDAILIAIIASIFVQTTTDNKKSEELTEKTQKLLEIYETGNYDADVILKEYQTINYETDKLNYINYIISLVINISYYIVFCYLNHGQTVGKKIMKIKIKSKDNELKPKQIVVRALLVNEILSSIILLILINFLKQDNYYIAKSAITWLQYTFIIISVFMILYRKDKLALQDIITKTEVIRELEPKEEQSEKIVKEKQPKTTDIETIDNIEIIKNIDIGINNQESERK